MFKLMKRYYFIFSLIIFSCSSGQEKEDYENAVILETIVLPKIINETSGCKFSCKLDRDRLQNGFSLFDTPYLIDA